MPALCGQVSLTDLPDFRPLDKLLHMCKPVLPVVGVKDVKASYLAKKDAAAEVAVAAVVVAGGV